MQTINFNSQNSQSSENRSGNNNNELDNYIFQDYNYEIELLLYKKILIVVLNILTGGIGTMLVPFLNKKGKKKL